MTTKKQNRTQNYSFTIRLNDEEKNKLENQCSRLKIKKETSLFYEMSKNALYVC